MRILYFSDIHIEIRRRDPGHVRWCAQPSLGLGPDLSAVADGVDLAILAGDIGTIRERHGASALGYARELAAFLRAPVVLVPGNHEYYGGVFDEDRAVALAGSGDGVTVLDRGAAIFPGPGDGLRVLGATLWTDYAALGNARLAKAEAVLAIADHQLIRRHGGTAPFLPDDAEAEHGLARAWLGERLAEAHAGPTLVVTHHVPHVAAHHPGFGLNALAPAFLSDCRELITAAAEVGVVAWVFGHHHWSHRVEVGGVTLVSAQLGYPGEATGWQGPGLLAVGA